MALNRLHLLSPVFLASVASALSAIYNNDRTKTAQIGSSGQIMRRDQSQSSVLLKTVDERLKEDPELFAGCTKIFFDVGSNRGTHIRKLFEPSKYPGCPYLKKFDAGFGPAEQRTRSSAETGICAFGFEANPRWAPRLVEIEEAYAKQGWRAKWFAPYAASDNDQGNLKLWKNDADGKHSDWGFSVAPFNDKATEVDVPEFDLSGFMQKMNELAPKGFRFMKMDIESAEFTVLPPFASKQILCKDVLDTITIEWHDRNGQEKKFFNGKEEALAHAHQVHDDVTRGDVCKTGASTAFEEFDDESYLDDGKPLPQL